MTYLVQLKLANSSRPANPQEGIAFIEQYILPTLTMCNQLEAEKKILAGGPVAGSVALALMVNAQSTQEVDRLVEGLPVWPRMETTITPLISFDDRAAAVRQRLESLKPAVQNER